MATRTVRTFCRNCSALCAMELDIVDGKPLRARADGRLSPYGAYLCPKGVASIEFHNGAEGRLLASLARSGGVLQPIPTDRALVEIGDRLAAIVAAHGPRSVAVYHGTGAYRSVLGGLMERAFVAALGTPNFFSTMTIDQSAKWVTMARMGTMASGRHAMRDADCMVLAGGNPLVSHQGAPFALAESGAPARAFEALKARGGRLVLVDPRRTETARFADLHIQPRPGEDAAIFAAIAHILLRDETFKADFVARHCANLDALRAAVAPFTPELAAARADVPVAAIETAARWLGEARRPLVGSGTGPSMAAHSNLADHMIETVNVLAGGYRRAGDAVRNPGTLRPKVAREMAVPPSRSWEQGPKCLSRDVGPLFGEFPAALLPDEITVDHPDRIRALIVFGGDPLVAVGDPAHALPAFQGLDLLVSLDARLNETAKHADYVIAASQGFERAELTIPGDSLFPEPFVQYSPALVERPGDVIDDWEFFWSIAARMGLPLTFKFWTYGLRFEDVQPSLPLSLADRPDPEALYRFLCRDSAVPFDDLLANPGGVRPDLPPHIVQPAPEGWSGRLDLCPPEVAAELSVVRAEPPDPAPLRLTCRRVLHALNGAYRDSRHNRRLHPVNHAWMHPADMAALGIADDTLVEIASAHGRIRAVARAEDRLRPGVVSMTHMFGPLFGGPDPRAEGGSNVGQLTSLTADLQTINFMPKFSGVGITVRPLERHEGRAP
ncbi:MAG: molybdopterin-dependent oxidoreductase [Sphingomonadales bacterium]|nr:molybdopterin-dependent oxidoreductase [Sphingomonadales bacterium]